MPVSLLRLRRMPPPVPASLEAVDVTKNRAESVASRFELISPPSSLDHIFLPSSETASIFADGPLRKTLMPFDAIASSVASPVGYDQHFVSWTDATVGLGDGARACACACAAEMID